MTEVTDVKRGNQQSFSLSGRTVPAFHFSTGTQPRSAQWKITICDCEENLVRESNAT
jgi:hypothetical protein